MNQESRVTSVVTPRGLEVTATTPNQIGSPLFGFIFLLVFGATALLLASDALTGDMPAWRDIAEVLFGPAGLWLWLGIIALTLMLVFAGHANEHWIFGRRSVERQQRIGRVVLAIDSQPLRRFADVLVEQRADGGWTVRLQSGVRVSRRGNVRRATLQPIVARPIPHADAVAVSERMRAWLAAPGSLPVESQARVPAPVAALERGASIVTSRLTMPVPLLIGLGALLVLGLGWQHREAAHERAEPLPRLDRTADGELLDYRWVVDLPELGDGSARVRLRAAVRYHDDGGAPHTLWLTTAQSVPLHEFGAWSLPGTVPWLGLPRLEFAVPAAADTTSIITALDDPYHLLVAQWSAPAEDWRISYRSSAPRYAMPARWTDAERAALADVAPAALLPLGAVALVLALLTLPRVLAPVRRRRWIGHAAVIALVLAVPWWSPHAERVPGWLGIDEWLLDATAVVLRWHAPADAISHTAIRRARPPRDSAAVVLVRWTPERSAAFPLLQQLRLDLPPDAGPHADAGTARAALVARAEQALDELEDDALASFLAGYVIAGWERRGGALHEQVVTPALCRSAARPERRLATAHAGWAC